MSLVINRQRAGQSASGCCRRPSNLGQRNGATQGTLGAIRKAHDSLEQLEASRMAMIMTRIMARGTGLIRMCRWLETGSLSRLDPDVG